MERIEPAEEELLTLLHNLQPTEFEEFLATLWNERGWDTETTEHNDHGVDVIARREFPIELEFHFQAKLYNTSLDPSYVREYSVLPRRPNVDVGVLVTNNSFTAQAREEAEKLEIKLINGEELVTMIHEMDVESILIDAVAEGKQIGDMIGVGEWIENQLAELGVSTITQLSKKDPKELASRTDISESRLERLVRHARYREEKPAEVINQIGPNRQNKLEQITIETVGDLAVADPQELSKDTGISDAILATCVERANQCPSQSLREIDGIGSSREEKFKQVNITTRGQLAFADPSELSDEIGLSETLIAELVEKA
jgi:predicted flap endonuclease-1-like 5' DNA nuclease